MTFRVALSLGQGIQDYFNKGIIYKHGDMIARNPEDLMKMYIDAGATEMYVRISTKRHNDGNAGSGSPYHARVHNLEKSLDYCRVAAKLKIPINPEIMLAYTYMDFGVQEAPDFKDYPEISKPNKPWAEYSLQEMNEVLEQYGSLVAGEILSTGCVVDYWNLGNEANYGFGGVNLGLKTAVNPALENKKAEEMYLLPELGADWLTGNVWCHNGHMMAALAKGIQKVAPKAKFSTHITTSVCTEYYITTYFRTLKENGFEFDHVGISFYPTSVAAYIHDPVGNVKKMIETVHQQLGVQVFIAEYSYPSERMKSGPFKDWDHPIPGYEVTPEDQARFTADFITWSKKNGVCGIRPWGPDLVGDWEPMSMFSLDLSGKIATAKPVMDVFNQISESP
ncbi:MULTISPECIES: glycosyl hydrolase 53 family protein [unclassified Bacillus (in: firmicutes)]|uniref:glycosyl hydrolase 53 family protein n=1 Tax=unclassified Bacillus (in: firmicutes) TaxID=185979 RepID=UPI00159B9F63|nr:MULTISPECIES: glycosyl hydrolase 53 family protein [unclassified Bacillus (in: firmicutes)]